ncbi:MAG: hypothetical protein R2769_05080 [Saprospiraceae bacterium]
MSRLIFFILGIGFFFSCQEVTIEPDQTGSAVFELTGKVDGEAFTFTAGEDGYFQNTNFQKNQLDQLELSGKLEEINCNTSCGASLQLF